MTNDPITTNYFIFCQKKTNYFIWNLNYFLRLQSQALTVKLTSLERKGFKIWWNSASK